MINLSFGNRDLDRLDRLPRPEDAAHAAAWCGQRGYYRIGQALLSLAAALEAQEDHRMVNVPMLRPAPDVERTMADVMADTAVLHVVPPPGVGQHHPMSKGGDGLGYGPCTHCGQLWPCETARAAGQKPHAG